MLEPNKLLAGWVYKKGEMNRSKLENVSIILSGVLLFIIITTAIMLLKTGRLDALVIPSIIRWLSLAAFSICLFLLYQFFTLFPAAIFSVYTLFFGIEEIEILFTNNKISSTNRSWILNDASHILTEVKYKRSARQPQLEFRGRRVAPGGKPAVYRIRIPVPPTEKEAAEKVYNYFREKLKKHLPLEMAGRTAFFSGN